MWDCIYILYCHFSFRYKINMLLPPLSCVVFICVSLFLWHQTVLVNTSWDICGTPGVSRCLRQVKRIHQINSVVIERLNSGCNWLEVEEDINIFLKEVWTHVAITWWDAHAMHMAKMVRYSDAKNLVSFTDNTRGWNLVLGHNHLFGR